MELPIIDNTDAYIDVCKKAGLPINKLPKKGDKLDLACLLYTSPSPRDS